MVQIKYKVRQLDSVLATRGLMTIQIKIKIENTNIKPLPTIRVGGRESRKTNYHTSTELTREYNEI